MSYFLAMTAQSGVRADGISYHNYGCGPPDTAAGKAACLNKVTGDAVGSYQYVIQREKQYYGAAIPTGVTEYNFDAGTQFLHYAAADQKFVFQYTEKYLAALESVGAAFADEFTTLNYAGYGDLDMFNDGAPYAPKSQYYAMVDMGEKAGSGSTVAIPTF
jgi:hypothetical protein